MIVRMALISRALRARCADLGFASRTDRPHVAQLARGCWESRLWMANMGWCDNATSWCRMSQVIANCGDTLSTHVARVFGRRFGSSRCVASRATDSADGLGYITTSVTVRVSERAERQMETGTLTGYRWTSGEYERVGKILKGRGSIPPPFAYSRLA